MHRLRSAPDLLTANLICDLLRHAGIEAEVHNANAQGGVGEIPVSEAWPQIWIADPGRAAEAAVLVDEFERRPADSGPERMCAACNEMSPQGFEFCWHCGAEFPE
ncbi:MAG: DUF2007 domain-containing protein [Gammaproteobacteria bacterium]|nr:DUF2007 domain-containing protein [Gammaproteobacteria bacterium]